MDKAKTEERLKNGLVLWAGKHGITPKAFAERMNYQYTTAWSILRGKSPFTVDAFGRFCIGYGFDAAAEVVEFGGIVNDEDADVSPLGEVNDGEIVPLVTLRSDQPTPKVKVRRAVVAEQAA